MSNWSDIALFAAVAEAGSLSAAARALGSSQPTLSRRLAALEAKLGVTLLTRSTHGLTLTPAGEQALAHAQRMAEDAVAIERLAEGQSRHLTGTVTISAPEGMGTDWLPKILVPFRDAYPDIVIHLQVENRAVDLVNREADVALRLVAPVQPSLIARKLAVIGFGLFASPGYIEQHGQPTSIAELKDHWMIGGDGPLNPVVERVEQSLTKGWPRMVIKSNSVNAMKSAIRAGYGIGVMSIRMGLNRPDRYIRILPDLTVAETGLWLVTHEEVRRSARIRAVTDYLADQIKKHAIMFAGQ